MKVFRRIAVLVATTGMTITMLSLAQAPASAAAQNVATRVVAVKSHSNVRFKSYINIKGQAQGRTYDGSWLAFPAETKYGKASLQRRYVGTTTWGTIATDTTAGNFDFRVMAVRNVDYRVVYSGATFSNSTDTFYFASSSSQNMRVLVRRNLNDSLLRSGRYFYIRGAIRPVAKRYVIIQRKTCSTCTYKYYKRVLSSSTGSFKTSIAVPRRGSYYYRAYVDAETNFAKSWSNNIYRTYRY